MPVREIVGRKEEIKILEAALNSNIAEMVAILGRRRVGKTFLIREVYKSVIAFDLIGSLNTTIQIQLSNFADQLTRYTKTTLPVPSPSNWNEAFKQLRTYLEKPGRKRKVVIFFDELPWLATPRSGFLEALAYFWNSWASQNKVVLVICGSAASWMIQKVVHDKGSLHNRITRTILLAPFTLGETTSFLWSKKVNLSHYQITQIYMVTGGIPFYLDDVQKGESVAQTIDRLCFSSHGILKDEFDKLYASLFNKADQHIAVVCVLANKWTGMTRHELLLKLKIPDGGSFSRILNELETSGFISSVPPIGKKKKETIYRLTDNFSLFYLKFMEGRKKSFKNAFQQLQQMQVWKTWRGYAFENICLMHIGQIKAALGISGVYTETGSYIRPGTNKARGAQIDIVIDRSDGIMNLCEVKFYDAPFTITKQYSTELRNKREVLRDVAGSKNVNIIMVTCFGIDENEYASELIDKHFGLEKLFL